MTKPTLKIEVIDGMQVIRCRKEDLDWESGKALAICVEDFRGQKGDPWRNVIYIEWYDGKLQVRMYDGDEDPIKSMGVKPDPALTRALHCKKTNLPRLLCSDDEAVIEIVERRLKEDE